LGDAIFMPGGGLDLYDLDGDGVAAPEEGDEEGQRGPGEVDVADLVAQGRTQVRSNSTTMRRPL
jgi:hypothetical protein